VSIATEILEVFTDQIDNIKVDRNAVHYGETATEVVVYLQDGRTVTGTFTTEQRESFGGVQFQTKKDIARLMIAKVRSVLEYSYA
jgi:hypothetical protein